jgi:hypothetical protein
MRDGVLHRHRGSRRDARDGNIVRIAAALQSAPVVGARERRESDEGGKPASRHSRCEIAAFTGRGKRATFESVAILRNTPASVGRPMTLWTYTTPWDVPSVR